MVGLNQVYLVGVLQFERGDPREHTYRVVTPAYEFLTMRDFVQDDVVVGVGVQCGNVEDAREVQPVVVKIAGHGEHAGAWQINDRAGPLGMAHICLCGTIEQVDNGVWVLQVQPFARRGRRI